MSIICNDWCKRTESMNGVFRFIHGYRYLIEDKSEKGKEFRAFAGKDDIYKPIFDQLFK